MKDSQAKHVTLTFLIISTQLITALFIPDMATVLTWVGGTTSGFINLTFPCLFYLKAFKDEKMNLRRFTVHAQTWSLWSMRACSLVDS